jgi:hypothetical protein
MSALRLISILFVFLLSSQLGGLSADLLREGQDNGLGCFTLFLSVAIIVLFIGLCSLGYLIGDAA